LDFYFVGIGYVSLDKEKYSGPGLQFNSLVSTLNLIDTLKNLGAVGECDHQPFDKSGNFLIDKPELRDLRSQLLNVPLEVLQDHVNNRSARVVAIAGGGIKHEAIYAALKAKIFNVLITDSLTALKLKEFANKEVSIEK
jgi:DNA-binding transcriptional regulator LsrR (DeoR family)